MPIHLQREIERLKKKILHLSAMVEENVRKAVRSMDERDARLAKLVIESDLEIDRMEVEVEEDCLKILALYQPVAIDLRFIVAMLKFNNDLERIGDLAANIAERAMYLAKTEKVGITFGYREMARKAETMLRKSLDSFVNINPELAREVCAADDEVDDMEQEIVAQVLEAVKEHPEQADRLLHHMFVAKHLERIADHATNIAEDVIYMARGEIVRHAVADRQKRQSLEK
jgi:phosphate transport system protein